MTADYFYMNVRSDRVEIVIQESTMKAEADICIEDFARALIDTNDNLGYLAKPIKDELIHRAENAYKDGWISEDEFNIFKTVLAVIEW